MKPAATLRIFALILMITGLCGIRAAAQSAYLPGQKLVAGNRTTYGGYGVSVVVSGNRMIAGAYGDNTDAAGANPLSSSGAVYVYERNPGTGAWVQTQKLVAADRASASGFGYAIALQGGRIVVGAYAEQRDAAGNNAYQDAGAVYIFDLNTTTGVWSQSQKIVASDRYMPVSVTNGLFGTSVALDGDRILVTAPRDGKDAAGGNIQWAAGSAYLFERNTATGVWQEAQKIVAGDRIGAAFWGWTCALQGNRLIIGADDETRDAAGNNGLNLCGAAYIFDRNTSTGAWSQTQKIVAADRSADVHFASSVSLSGNRIIIGAPFDDNDASGLNPLTDAGSAYFFDRNTTTGLWAQTQKIAAASRQADARFGVAAAQSGDVAIIGAYLDGRDEADLNMQSYAGAVYVYGRATGTGVWSQKKKIVAKDRAANGYFGGSLSMAGGDVAVGAFNDSRDAAGANAITGAGALYMLKSQNAINLDGTDDYVSLPANPVAASPEMTFEAWVYWNGGGYWQRIMDFGNSAGNNIFFTASNSNNGLLRLVIGVGGNEQLIDGAALPTGGWHHVAVTTTSAGVWTMYLDGAQVGQNSGHTYTPATLGATAANYLGKSQYNDPYFSGSIDEVRIWNRALCQAEIVANMSGELPNPALQTGLVSYYTFDQGAAGGDNTGISAVIDAGAAGNAATLVNVARIGATSNFVTGAALITATGAQYAPTAPSTTTESVTKIISGTTTVTGCGAIATVAPSGGSAVSGSITAKVTIDGAVQSYGGHAYVQRHYDIAPATGASTATGTVTLYYTQAEFNAYNAANGTDADLPANASDAIGAANLRITQYHGTGTTPGTYSGTAVRITPASVTFNSTAARWQVTFPVTGFSGFFATGNLGAPLPVRLTAFSAQPSGSNVRIAWSVADARDMSRYIVEHSADGSHFTALTAVLAADNVIHYTADDVSPFNGRNYYRLKMEGLDGSFIYSSTELVMMGKSGIYFQLSPVPAKDLLTIETNDATLNGTAATLTDMQGRRVMSIAIGGGRQSVSLDGLQAGVYMLRLSNGQSYKVVKE